MDWPSNIAGLLVGLLVGMTGVGGGALMMPILVLLFGMAPAVAVGTDLWFAALTKLVGGGMHQRHGSVDWQVLRRLWAGSLPAAVATLVWLQQSQLPQARQGLLVQALGGVLVLSAAALVMRRKTQAVGQRLRTQSPRAFKRAQPALTVLAGALLGALVTLTAVGPGALGAVFLLYLYPLRMTPPRLVGTDIVHAVPLTLVAGTGHLLMGHVDLPLLGQLLLGSVPGVVLGALLGTRVPAPWLRTAIAMLLLAVGLKLLTA